MKWPGEVPSFTKPEPVLESLPIPVQGEEVLEIVVGEKEIGNAFGLARILIGA